MGEANDKRLADESPHRVQPEPMQEGSDAAAPSPGPAGRPGKPAEPSDREPKTPPPGDA